MPYNQHRQQSQWRKKPVKKITKKITKKSQSNYNFIQNISEKFLDSHFGISNFEF